MIYDGQLPARIFAALGERREFNLGDVVEAMGAKTYRERNDLFRCLKVMSNRGLIRRSGAQGFIRCDDTRSAALWRWMRASKSSTLDDLIEVAGGLEESYIRRWLTAMIRSGYVRRDGRTYRLITDSREEPPVKFIKCENKTSKTRKYNGGSSPKSANKAGRKAKKRG